MTRKNIDAMRELRLWISQVIVPVATIVGAAMTVPEIRYAVGQKYEEVKNNIKGKFKK